MTTATGTAEAAGGSGRRQVTEDKLLDGLHQPLAGIASATHPASAAAVSYVICAWALCGNPHALIIPRSKLGFCRVSGFSGFVLMHEKQYCTALLLCVPCKLLFEQMQHSRTSATIHVCNRWIRLLSGSDAESSVKPGAASASSSERGSPVDAGLGSRPSSAGSSTGYGRPSGAGPDSRPSSADSSSSDGRPNVIYGMDAFMAMAGPVDR